MFPKSIKQRMESHTAKLDQEYLNQTPTKLSKKEKKKLKEAKKLKNKKLNDADKVRDFIDIIKLIVKVIILSSIGFGHK